jgi:hypothetical protein
MRRVAGDFSGSTDAMVDLSVLPGANPPPKVTEVYVDVLESYDARGPHRGQRVLNKKWVTRIYEHLWRPFISRAFFGPFGPGAHRAHFVSARKPVEAPVGG